MNKEQASIIFQNLAIHHDDSTIDQNDYLALRNKPFQKTGEYEFRVVFDSFLIKKIYNGLVFKLSSYDKNFLSRIRNDFSEGVLLYDILKTLFSKRDVKMISGNEFKEANVEREPDFFIRESNDLLLFESKISLCPAARNFHTISMLLRVS